MTDKETFFIRIYDDDNPDIFGLGECALFRGLSAEDSDDYYETLKNYCRGFNGQMPDISSIRFGVESALDDMGYRSGQVGTEPFQVRINGLIWMGDKSTMFQRISKKLDEGFRCLKLKIGGIDFEEEVDLLRYIRQHFSPDALELRLDANGSFKAEEALDRLNRLSRFHIHSIEQPVKPGQYYEMSRIIADSPIAIALDEELIGCCDDNHRQFLLDTLKPHYIILKPSLCGGFASADRWVALAEERGVGWWATSALESNVGLTAIARWLRKYDIIMPQGLGTGALYSNNLPSDVSIEGEYLFVGDEVNIPSSDYVNKLFE